jgi:hypothetical protein
MGLSFWRTGVGTVKTEEIRSFVRLACLLREGLVRVGSERFCSAGGCGD